MALVLVKHAWSDATGSLGAVGVVAFFTLSGYLITGILHRDIEAKGRVRFGRFYRNRLLRLYPPLLLLLVATAVVTGTVDPLGERSSLAIGLTVAALYLTDVPFDIGSSALAHLWTLATEEQFYLVWPLLLTFGLRRRRLALVVVVAAAVIVIVLAMTFIYFSHGGRLLKFYRLPTSWCIAMVVGAALQLWGSPLARAAPAVRNAAAAIGVVILLGFVFGPPGVDNLALYVVVGPVSALCTAAVIDVVRHWQQLPSRALRPLLALGTISYAAYLWNYPITRWLELDGSLKDWHSAVLSIALTIGAATVSYWAIERPIAHLRRRLDSVRVSAPAVS